MQFRFWALLALLPLAISSPLPSSVEKRQTAFVTFLTQALAHLPWVNGPLDKVTGALTSVLNTFSVLTWKTITYNDLENSYAPCKDYTLIFARGTSEPGNVGMTVAPAFIDAIRSRVGGKSKLAIQGVKYGATVQGYLKGGDPDGSANL